MTPRQPFRLARGGLIDRSQPIPFECNGTACVGYKGDTLASALLANGVCPVGRSFKFHRPRGVMSAGVEETNALFRVDIDGQVTPLVQATQQPLIANLVATTENAWPSVHVDIGRLLDLTHRMWPAGFYNKTFKWPSWHWYEGSVRHSAGSGRVPTDLDGTQYFQHNLHCDVLVVGGGPAALSAALAAGESGAHVVLAELEPNLGGSLRQETRPIDGLTPHEWLKTTVAKLESMPDVRLLRGTTVAGAFDHETFLAVDRSDCHRSDGPVERVWKIRARRVVLATGAIEQPLIFEDNDRPGIVLAGAVRRYVREFAVAVGRSVIVATNNDDAYETAFALHEAGIVVPAVVDSRREPSLAVAAEAARRGLTVLLESALLSAKGTAFIRSVRIGRLQADGTSIEDARTIDCDALAISGGWCPSVHLYSQARGQLRFDGSAGCFVPAHNLPRWFPAGAANGCFALSSVLREGAEAGRAAARSLEEGTADMPTSSEMLPFPAAARALWRSPTGDSSRQWVDFRHDVTVADLELAVRENYTSVEHVKRYTTAGMSDDQGKTANLNALSLLAELTHRSIPATGTTTFRPMYSPVSMGAIAAGQQKELYSPTHRLPAETWHRAAGAVFDEYGGWQRPAFYPGPREDRSAAIQREVGAVRQRVGVFDGSPLGKIEVKGPDAAEFLHRLYINNVHSLIPGRVRYGVMLNENGVVIDDGVFVRMESEHFLVCTTSNGAKRISAWLEEWHQCEWPDLRLVIAPVTTQWAVCTVAGPQARVVLQGLETDIDLSHSALPHLAFASGRLLDVPARVQRVSFTGEISFEVSVPARAASEVFEAIAKAGAPYGIAPFGVEALLVMRTEKGYLHVGIDSDGTTNPYDLGFKTFIDKKPGEFVGRRSLQRSHDRDDARRQFVGVEPIDPGDRMIAGAHLVSHANRNRPRSEGFVTSACLSPTLNRTIGLALLEGGFKRTGDVVSVVDAGREFEARVVNRSFYDPQGERLRG